MKRILTIILMFAAVVAGAQTNSFDVQRGTIRKHLYMVPNASAPSAPLMGTLYFDTDTNYYWFDGVQWQQFGGGDIYWTLSGDTLGTSYNVRLDSSFLMQAGKWHIGYAKEDQHDDNADSLVYLGYCDYNNTGKVSTIEVRKNDSDTNYYIYMYARSNKGSTQYTQTDSTIVINSENIYMPDITSDGGKFQYIVGLDPNGRLFPQPLASGYDSMMYAVAAAPTPSTTWIRDDENKQLYIADKSDKIKELYTKERQKRGFVTFSFDDGNKSDYTRMLPLFKAKGAVADANIVTSRVGLNANFMTWAEIDSLETNGWEILSHSRDHLNLDTISVADLIVQLKDSKDTLESHGFEVNSFAYPYGGYDDTVKHYARKYYRSGRGTGGSSGNIGYINTSPLNTFGLTTYNLDLPSDTTVSKTLIDSVNNYGGWLIFYIHATIAEDSVAIARMIDYTQAAGISIVTTSQALDSIGNSLDVSGGLCINDNNMRVEGVIYNGYYPYIHSTKHSTADGRNFFAGYAAGNLTLSPLGGASTLASQNTGVGYQALTALTTGYNNAALGSKAGRKTTTGYNNMAIGNSALSELTEGYSNTAIGNTALKNGVSIAQCTAIGYCSGFYATANNNTYVGASAGYGATSGCIGQNNVAVGALSMEKYTGADGNTAIGFGSLNSLTSGDYNVAIGSSSGAALTTGGQHVMIGYRAGRYDVTTNANVIIGTDAGYGVNGSSTYGYSTILGYKAGYSLTTGNYNTLLGYNAGYTNATGTSNIMLGYRAGYNETGSYKSYFAHDSTSWSNGMATGSKLMWYSDASNADKANHFINLFGKVAIGEAKALSAYSLEVVGDANIIASLKVGTYILATPATTPGSPTAGMIYYNTSDNHFYGYNGTGWVQLDN